MSIDREEAELRGHQHITCSCCGYKGWSDDGGGCPNDECPTNRVDDDCDDIDNADDEGASTGTTNDALRCDDNDSDGVDNDCDDCDDNDCDGEPTCL